VVRKIPEIIIEADLIKVLKAAKHKHHKLAFALGFYQAMRVSEIVNLQPENIDINQKLIRIKQAKGSKDRNIPIAPEVYRGLKKALPINCGIRALQIAFNKATKEALNRKCNIHLLRHSGASHYLNVKKWDLRSVQIFLGHSKVAVTEIYTHVSPADLISRMWQ